MLVFDDGPCENTEHVLDLLADYRLKATFALVGRNVAKHADVVERMRAEGHTIVNHTFTHARLAGMSEVDIHIEVGGAEVAIEDACGIRTMLLRPPFNAVDDVVRTAARRLSYSLLSGSSMGDYRYDNPDELAHAARSYRGVLALHDTHDVTVAALPAILEQRRLVAA